MYTIILVVFINFLCIKCETDSENENYVYLPTIKISQISDSLLTLLSVDREDQRFQELTEKLKKIDVYVIDKDTFTEIVRNETNDDTLNSTNFYESLADNDYYRFLAQNDTSSLYQQLKQRLNRDDIIDILQQRNHDKIVKSARKSLTVNDAVMGVNDDNVIDVVVDRILAEKPKDNHKFDIDKTSNASLYFDPKIELEELKEHYQRDGRRIYRGERTSVRAYPFMVTLHVMQKFWCGGVLHYHDIVLTSCSCLQLMHNNRFFRENPRVLQVRMGSNHSRIGGELIDVLEVYFHPAYNPRTLRNNIAVIRLRRSIFMKKHRIPKIIDIKRSKFPMPTTTEILMLGWGVTKMSQKLAYEPVYLQRKFLPVYPNVFCKEVYGEKFISDTMFCAGTFTTGEGACDHDAGGPAILAGYLVGIISFGPAICGFPDAPTVFTLVGAYADWIDSIRMNMPDYYRGRLDTTTTTLSPFQVYIKNSRFPPMGTTQPHTIQPQTTPEKMEPPVVIEDAELDTETPTNTSVTIETAPGDIDVEIAPGDIDVEVVTPAPATPEETTTQETTTEEPTTQETTTEEPEVDTTEEPAAAEPTPIPALRKRRKKKQKKHFRSRDKSTSKEKQ